MSNSYDVTNHEADGDSVKVWIFTRPDGSLSVAGCNDGTNSLNLKSDAVRRLCTLLAGRFDLDPADTVAKSLIKTFGGDLRAFEKIRELCDRLNVAYRKSTWVPI